MPGDIFNSNKKGYEHFIQLNLLTDMLMSISQNQYNLTMPEYKKSSTNIKFEYWKCIRISEKIRFQKRNISLAGARTHKSITLEQGKNSKCTSLIMNTF